MESAAPGTQIDYSTRGGLRWGTTFWRAGNATWPFARLRASAAGITISVRAVIANEELEFRQDEVVGIEKRRGLFTPGVRIVHTNPGCPPFVLFWTYQRADVMANLARFGFRVID